MTENTGLFSAEFQCVFSVSHHKTKNPLVREDFNFMETAGVEPASENLFIQLSPGADRLLNFLHMPPAVR